ncbi:IS3 family transposase [Haemophilus haemolyticus]
MAKISRSTFYYQTYIVYYNQKRIKLGLKGLSPV